MLVERKQLLLFGEAWRDEELWMGIIYAGEHTFCKCHGASVGAPLSESA